MEEVASDDAGIRSGHRLLQVIYIFDNYTLDGDKRELRDREVVVQLQPQVFDLLEFLLRNRDRVVSKDEILAAVWGGWIVSESTLASRINAARSAIGDNGEDQRLIRTFLRKGVRFVGQAREVQASSDAGTAKPERLADGSASVDVVDLLPLVKVPTIVFHSIHDHLIPFSQGRLLACSIPSARFVPLDSENHAPLSSEPAWIIMMAEMETFLADGD